MVDAVLQRVRLQVCEAQEDWRQKCALEKDDERPFVTLTYAQSIDGSIAAERGTPTLLSGSASMQMTHVLRKNPRPIIVDTNLRCPTSIKLFTSSTCEKPIILCGRSLLDPEILERRQALEALGAHVLECQTVRGEDGRDHVDLRDAFRVVKQHGISTVMVEGGASLLTSCLQENFAKPLVDLVVVTVAPTFIGGLRAVTGSLAASESTLSASSTAPTSFPRLQHPHYHVLDQDLVILGRFAAMN
ncbi:hypothetical protein PHYBOEH_000328 [Phytophthora boehmeriae]|uniref:Bacterial bifunctional deaminase-reductase C-terminal domain-containing protein n=1 Tax=Phytophthora boehmeriae TaxID=109152 RepID=A0A8T1WZQ7_9STRA|nr:hypothetical protein PHYBOEH_000328 [Phytophthora boehmeriae]